MKKLLIIAIVCLTVKTAAAQVVVKPGNTIPKVPKTLIATKPTVVVNRTTSNYPDVVMRVDVTIEDAGEKGFEVKFQSGMAIERVEISRLDPKQIMNTLTLAANQTTGSFYMDASSYKGSNTYSLVFYVAGMPKGIWTTLIKRKVK